MADSLKQVINQKLPLNRAIISDILLWITLALLLAYGIYLFAVLLPSKRGQSINLHFKNANEVSAGAAVRMLGMDIGFVDSVRIRNDHVEVVVQTDPKAPRIPSGSTFTILFTGLAGAKSIEVEPPDSPRPSIGGKPIYLVEEPIRMEDALNASLEETQALQKGAENITDFFGKKKPVEELQFNIQQTHQMTVVALQHFEGMNQAVHHIRKEITVNMLAGIDTIGGLSHGAQNIARMSDPVVLRPKVSRTLQFAQKLGKLFNTQSAGAINTITLQNRLMQFNQTNTQLSDRMQQVKNQVTNFPLWQWLQRFDTQSAQAGQFLDRANAFFSPDKLPALKHARQTIEAFNRKLLEWNAKLDAAQPAPGQGAPAPKSH
jgi:ABC-type transporter Mla subunit MlaD